MQLNKVSLFEILNRSIREMETIEDDPDTMNFVARRLGNIVKHMKDLRADLQTRPASRTNPTLVDDNSVVERKRFSNERVPSRHLA